jgi:hypothetical protein
MLLIVTTALKELIPPLVCKPDGRMEMRDVHGRTGCFLTSYFEKMRLNNPCAVGNRDTTGFLRGLQPVYRN